MEAFNPAIAVTTNPGNDNLDQDKSEKVKILVIDDLPEKLLAYEIMLEDLGHELIMSSSGNDALKLILKNEFAVILLDVNMPGMDGFETATLIRSRKKSASTPIIFLTAFTDEIHVSQGYATGAVDYLPTPVVPEILRTKVKVFVELFLMRKQAAHQAEERARRIAAEEADHHKDQFLGMLAHELRNPLGPISNATCLLKHFLPKESREEQLREIIERQVVHMARLVDDLLDATRLARGQILLRKERCDLVKIVVNAAEDYKDLLGTSGLKFEINTPATPIWLDGDQTRLSQVIGNLLHNAHKFTPPGGTITITVGYDEEESIASIEVADTGIGITPDMLPRVFDVFCQADQELDRSRGGLGLGLALVKGLVQLHNGVVSVKSNGANKGASFAVSLPLEPIYRATERKHQRQLKKYTKRKILLIEDNSDAAETSRMLLEMNGHEVRLSLDGPRGLKEAMDFRPEVIVCDIGLPHMSGFQVAREIRKNMQLKDTFLVALTGYGREEDQGQTKEAGFNVHLTKPLDSDKLLHIISNLS